MTFAGALMVLNRTRVFFLSVFFFVGISNLTIGQESQNGKPAFENMPHKITLIDAVMCEGIKDGNPYNGAVVFSKTIGEVVCFTVFDFIQESTFIYHRWFFRDVLNRTTKLTVNPPRWSTYSSINIRESDMGPWHVEVADEQGNVLQILRFSIVE